MRREKEQKVGVREGEKEENWKEGGKKTEGRNKKRKIGRKEKRKEEQTKEEKE